MDKNIRDILKSSLVGILAVIIFIIPFEKIFGSSTEVFGIMPTIYLLPIFLIYSVIGFVYSKKNSSSYPYSIANWCRSQPGSGPSIFAVLCQSFVP